MPIDHRDLLKRYMRHVRLEEGTTFLPGPDARTSLGALCVSFTDEEFAELSDIEHEALFDFRHRSFTSDKAT